MDQITHTQKIGHSLTLETVAAICDDSIMDPAKIAAL